MRLTRSPCCITYGKPGARSTSRELPAIGTYNERAIAMFQNDQQRARVCRAILMSARLDSWGAGNKRGELWTDDGPTTLAISLLERDGGGMSTGERIMFMAAWSLWNGDGTCTLHDVAFRIDGNNLRCLSTLLLAINEGSQAIDDWLLDRGL